MTAPQVRGITGLLDGILSPARPVGPNCQKARQPKNTLLASQSPLPSDPPLPVPVRRGRPPGKATATSPKEKVTVWISSSLIAEYRDWTWEARCQLSHLVERALAHHRESRSRTR
jgi:hypothetical protein